MASSMTPETTPAREPASTTRVDAQSEASPARSGLRESVRGMGFQEGSRTLSPGRSPAAPPSVPEASRSEVASAAEGAAAGPKPSPQAYEQALGRMLGGALFDAVVKQTSPESLSRYAGSVVAALMKAGEGLAKDDASLDEAGRKAVIEALKEQIGPALKAEAEAYLAGEEGRSLAAALQSYGVQHPWQVVAAAILAAAGAVAANVEVPRIGAETSGTLGRGKDAPKWTAGAGVRLGKVRDLTLQAIDAQIALEAGRFRGEVRVDHRKDQGTTAQVSGTYGTDDASVTTQARLDREGLLSASAGARIRTDHGEATLGVSKERGHAGAVDATVQWADGSERVLKGAAKVEAGGAWSVRLSQEITKEAWQRIDATEMTSQGVRSSTEVRYQQGPLAVGGRIENGGGPGGGAASGNVTWRTEDLTAALKAELGAGGKATVSGDVDAQVSDRWSVGGSARYDLASDRLLAVGLRFGFRDPKEFEAFLVEWRRENAADVPIDRFRVAVEHTLGAWMVRAENQATWKDGRFSEGVGSIQTARALDQNWKVIAGVSAGYGPDKTQGIRPEIGLQYKNIPVTVGYDLNQKAVGIRLTIPFGR